MVSSNVLLIRHMPADLTDEERDSFFKHFGATGIKVIGSKNNKTNNIYARFDTHKAAEVALKRLHQIELLGQLIAVEFARGDHLCDTNVSTSLDKTNVDEKKKENSKKYYDNFLFRLSTWATEVDFNIPPPVHLKYQYPPPSKKVLGNIAKALATVPKFYTQVLHLMNKMNLPCPFVENFPIETDIFEDKINKEDIITNIEVSESANKVESSEEESEIENSSDDQDYIRNPVVIPLKRKLPDSKKLAKRPKFIKPPINPPLLTNRNVLKKEEVFEISEKDQVMRKIEVKITPDLVSIQEAEQTQKSQISVAEGFEKLPANEDKYDKSEESKIVSTDDDNVASSITEQELAANRIPERDQKILPVFKNYQPGAPSCRLYIKNLAKQVQTRDLHYIYRRYFVPDQEEEQGTMFDIRLMQEGRMKGQAFINLQSVKLAQQALKETNGYILKDKPMVVQFARSSKANN